MRLSLLSLIRATATIGIVLFGMAVGLGRMAPPATSWRSATSTGPIHLSGPILDAADRTPRFLDAESGEVRPFHLPDGEGLEYASCSPWLDEEGERQVVGLWTSRSGRANERVLDRVSLGRFRYPSGEPLGGVPIEIIPTGPALWFAGTKARLLFPASDGRLHQVVFEGAEADLLGDGPRPRPLEHEGGLPELDRSLLRDPSWLAGAATGPTLLVARSPVERGSNQLPAIRIGWLRLDPHADRIVTFGDLDRTDDTRDERCPISWLSGSGATRLAYLARDRGASGWRLHLDTLEIDAATGVPRRTLLGGRPLVADCLPVAPTVSADGRSILVLARGPSGVLARRVDIGG